MKLPRSRLHDAGLVILAPIAYLFVSLVSLLSGGFVVPYLLAFPSSFVLVDVLQLKDFLLPMLGAGVLQWFGLALWAVLAKRKRIWRAARVFGCQKCGYSLVGVVADKCPECGDNLWNQPR